MILNICYLFIIVLTFKAEKKIKNKNKWKKIIQILFSSKPLTNNLSIMIKLLITKLLFLIRAALKTILPNPSNYLNKHSTLNSKAEVPKTAVIQHQSTKIKRLRFLNNLSKKIHKKLQISSISKPPPKTRKSIYRYNCCYLQNNLRYKLVLKT